ncbi:MAG: ABC transporter substrate-binding protein [Termitinemataceae bacterium]|nr:MAG: ABC transporter substrate-binding protein [Termitinemataceae bacterium]
MKKLVVVICAVVSLSCAKKSTLNEITFALDWTPNTNHSGIFAAQELGFFDAEGLKVTIVQSPEDGAVVLTASGSADFGVDFQESLGPAIALARDPLPVIAVAAIVNHNTSGLMSLQESGIARPADLQGKRFASWQTATVDAIIKVLVENDGGVFDKVNMIPNNAVDAFSALQTDIDSIWIYYAWDGIAAEVNNIPINFIDIAKTNPLFDWYTPVIIANKNYAAQAPDTTRKFLRAVSKGYDYVIANPKEAADILLKAAPELDPLLVKASMDYLAPLYKAGQDRWGEIDAARWNNFYSWMYENKLLEVDIAHNSNGTGFTNEFLP